MTERTDCGTQTETGWILMAAGLLRTRLELIAMSGGLGLGG